MCTYECPDGPTFDACTEECLSGLSQAEVTKLNEVAHCFEISGCDDDECLQQTCATELQACIGG